MVPKARVSRPAKHRKGVVLPEPELAPNAQDARLRHSCMELKREGAFLER
jgi:hypothetical protein